MPLESDVFSVGCPQRNSAGSCWPAKNIQQLSLMHDLAVGLRAKLNKGHDISHYLVHQRSDLGFALLQSHSKADK